MTFVFQQINLFFKTLEKQALKYFEGFNYVKKQKPKPWHTKRSDFKIFSHTMQKWADSAHAKEKLFIQTMLLCDKKV